MLYHTTRISLNRPFINPNTTQDFNQSFRICETSADIIVSILRRFKAQHSLLNCPLLFVYAAIKAVDITFTADQYQNIGTPVITDTNLLTLDSALNELSYAWTLAGQARKGLQDLLNKRRSQMDENLSISSSSFASDVEFEFSASAAPDALHKTECLEVPQDNFKIESSIFNFQAISNIAPYGALDSTDPSFWDTLGMIDDGIGSWSSNR